VPCLGLRMIRPLVVRVGMPKYYRKTLRVGQEVRAVAEGCSIAKSVAYPFCLTSSGERHLGVAIPIFEFGPRRHDADAIREHPVEATRARSEQRLRGRNP